MNTNKLTPSIFPHILDDLPEYTGEDPYCGATMTDNINPYLSAEAKIDAEALARSTTGPFVAVYARHHAMLADSEDTLEGASRTLNDGSEYGQLAPIGVWDAVNSEWVPWKKGWDEED